MEENMALVEISRAQQMLERASDIHEIIDVRDKFMAIQIFTTAQGFREAAQEAKIYQLKAERKAGDWLERNVSAGNPQLYQDDTIRKLPDGIDRKESSRWQLEAKLPEEEINDWVDDCLSTGKEITAAGLRRRAGGAHVGHNSGDNEWYTPKEYIDAAREVMGEIDLDPASSEIANKTVKAKIYFTYLDDGLQYSWDGKVWMNPPYASELVGKFSEKLVNHFMVGEVTEAIVLVNNSTETKWFSNLVSVASAIVFPVGRVRFLDELGNPGAPLQGQAVIYLGDNPGLFIESFSRFGWSAMIWHSTNS